MLQLDSDLTTRYFQFNTECFRPLTRERKLIIRLLLRKLLWNQARAAGSPETRWVWRWCQRPGNMRWCVNFENQDFGLDWERLTEWQKPLITMWLKPVLLGWVCMREAQEVWMAVLCLGLFDLYSTPSSAGETFRRCFHFNTLFTAFWTFLCKLCQLDMPSFVPLWECWGIHSGSHGHHVAGNKITSSAASHHQNLSQSPFTEILQLVVLCLSCGRALVLVTFRARGLNEQHWGSTQALILSPCSALFSPHLYLLTVCLSLFCPSVQRPCEPFLFSGFI